MFGNGLERSRDFCKISAGEKPPQRAESSAREKNPIPKRVSRELLHPCQVFLFDSTLVKTWTDRRVFFSVWIFAYFTCGCLVSTQRSLRTCCSHVGYLSVGKGKWHSDEVKTISLWKRINTGQKLCSYQLTDKTSHLSHYIPCYVGAIFMASHSVIVDALSCFDSK